MMLFLMVLRHVKPSPPPRQCSTPGLPACQTPIPPKVLPLPQHMGLPQKHLSESRNETWTSAPPFVPGWARLGWGTSMRDEAKTLTRRRSRAPPKGQEPSQIPYGEFHSLSCLLHFPSRQHTRTEPNRRSSSEVNHPFCGILPCRKVHMISSAKCIARRDRTWVSWKEVQKDRACFRPIVVLPSFVRSLSLRISGCFAVWLRLPPNPPGLLRGSF
ncbi:hypothetical protein QBC39DRAFT_106648 [Podospora conica]|nr:hypothetical protein QBC39DRAFT_106648 [Schizothecium conicum]